MRKRSRKYYVDTGSDDYDDYDDYNERVDYIKDKVESTKTIFESCSNFLLKLIIIIGILYLHELSSLETYYYQLIKT